MTAHLMDTSVLVAWYLPESFSQEARKWQKRLLANEIELYVPRLHYYEFSNVLRTYVKRREIEMNLARDILETHMLAPLVTLDPDPIAILNTALEYDMTAYDAAFVVLALERKLTLITAERSATGWIKRLGSMVQSIV